VSLPNFTHSRLLKVYRERSDQETFCVDLEIAALIPPEIMSSLGGKFSVLIRIVLILVNI
jgi:hypothetical protein